MVKQVGRSVGILAKTNWSTHGVHDSPWHASHALMRLYTTVLHLHILPLSASLAVGPAYESPGNKVGTKNTAHADKVVCDAPKSASTDRRCCTSPPGTL